jgi:hypothetical protein
MPIGAASLAAVLVDAAAGFPCQNRIDMRGDRPQELQCLVRVRPGAAYGQGMAGVAQSNFDDGFFSFGMNAYVTV